MDQNLNEEKFSKKLLRVMLPISGQSLIAASLNFVDTLMVGRLGEAEIAAVGFSVQFTFIFWLILFGFTGGTITYMAQFYGKGDLVSIRRVTGIATTVSFLIGAGFFCLCFFFTGHRAPNLYEYTGTRRDGHSFFKADLIRIPGVEHCGPSDGGS